MKGAFSSTLLLTLLLAIGLGFFLRAASKDRTTIVDIQSSLPPLDVLNGISAWLEERGWNNAGGDAEAKVLRFNGSVASSSGLAFFLSILGGCGGACLGLVIYQLYPMLAWWPLLLSIITGPFAGIIYKMRSSRVEFLELKLLSAEDNQGSILRVRAHRDELIALELELAQKLDLKSDGSLLSSPI